MGWAQVQKNIYAAEVLSPGSAETLLTKAAQCRRLASSIADHQTSCALNTLAEEYERDANHSVRLSDRT
ncbi:MAG: hypothetical protein EOP60_04330 [Sphingomonadales bacterium]|nr:MAG: hypothetical protein EOP60_04330 [Sphingomonadales bacterium]